MADGRKLAGEAGLATVVGGSGFVGTQIVQLLAQSGYRIKVAVRRPDLAGHLRPLGAVGQVVPIQANVRNEASIRQAVAGADVVINLAGILFERGKQRFAKIHDEGAALVARAAREAGAQRLVHMSALGADPEGDSAYQRSKAAGETDVLKAFPEAVIMRPSIIFGPEDRFFNLFATLARISPVLPVVGAKSRFQPVYVRDVAEAFMAAVEGKARPGGIYELGGPDVETMRELMERMLVEIERKRLLVELPEGLARLKAVFLQLLPRPLLTPDQVIQLQRDNVVGAAALAEHRTLEGLGIEPTAMEAILPTYMWRFRKHGEFDRLDVPRRRRPTHGSSST